MLKTTIQNGYANIEKQKIAFMPWFFGECCSFYGRAATDYEYFMVDNCMTGYCVLVLPVVIFVDVILSYRSLINIVFFRSSISIILAIFIAKFSLQFQLQNIGGFLYSYEIEMKRTLKTSNLFVLGLTTRWRSSFAFEFRSICSYTI